MYRIVYLSILTIIGYSIQNVESGVSSAIPELLHDCYTNDTIMSYKPPLTLQLFLQIIRKLELNTENSFDARILATSMLHTIILDGIIRSQDIGDQVVIPFRATGEEFFKYKLLVDYLTSGESSLFPSKTLTIPELCLLHTMLSNTVDPWERGDESSTCSHRSSMPLELAAMEEHNQYSSCPIKKGTVATKWGSVSIGHIIAAIASAFQKTRVSFERIEVAVNEKIDNKQSLTTNNNSVDNVWVATVAGDLATVILKQTTTIPEFGTDGFWNDTLLPRVYYLKTTEWDMTESDILGGIDGLAIAHYLENDELSKLRLSQLIDIFYSERKILNNDLRVTNRSHILNQLINEINIQNQVSNSAKLLQKIGVYDFKLTSQSIDDRAKLATEKFKVIAGNITKKYDNVETIHEVPLKSSMEIIVILDGSTGSYEALQLIHGLTEVAQVSYYGSKLGVLNGESGKWMSNVTNDLFQLFNNLDAQSQNAWPSSLNLGNSLESVIYYYDNKTRYECEYEKKKPMAQVVMLVSTGGYLTDNDLKSSLRAFNSIKKSNPETSFILLSSSEAKTSFEELTRNFWDNDYVVTPSGKTNSVIQDLANTLSEIPGNIIDFYCKRDQQRLEDFITPTIETRYMIRKEYLQVTPITTKFSRGSFGSLVICVRNGGICKDITVNDEISFDSVELCAPESACNLEFSISVNTTEISCTENSCRYPDQVRLEIIWQRSSGYVSTTLHICNMFIVISLILIL